MSDERDLANPDFEPSEADFTELLTKAFAPIVAARPIVDTPPPEAERARKAREARIAELQRNAAIALAAFGAKTSR